MFEERCFNQKLIYQISIPCYQIIVKLIRSLIDNDEDLKTCLRAVPAMYRPHDPVSFDDCKSK